MQIGDEGAAAIAAALKTNDSLLALSLASNEIGLMGGAALTAGVHDNKALVALEIQHNK